MKEYRTDEQWNNMVENIINGNWSDAAQNAVDAGFYSNDMINRIESDELNGAELTDFIILSEMAENLRHS